MPHKYTIKDLENSQKEILITEIDAELLKKSEKSVIDDLSKSLKIKGFRPGNIPESAVRDHVEDSYLQAQTLEKALPELVNGIIADEKLRILGQPNIAFDSLDPLKLKVVFDMSPEIKLGDYRKITVKVDKKVVADKDVDEAIGYFQNRLTDHKDVDRAAKKDDKVELDFEGFTPDGVPMENTKSTDHPVVLGSNMLIPGFEDNVIGMKTGEEKEFTITFPKDYHAKSLANKEAVFKIKVKKVSESSLPEVDEAFVEEATGKKMSVKDWKKSLKDQIIAENERIHRTQIEEAYYDKLIALTELEIPKTMIEEEKQSILADIKQNIIQRGLSYEKYLKANGKTEEELLESFDKQSADRIKLRLALAEIAEKEGIGISDVEIEERLNKLLETVPEEQRPKIKEQYQPGGNAYQVLEFQLKMQKTLEKVLPKG